MRRNRKCRKPPLEIKTHSDNATSKPSKNEAASRGQSSEMPDGGARKVTRRGRPTSPFRDCIYTNDDVVQENIWKSSKLLQKAEKERKSDL